MRLQEPPSRLFPVSLLTMIFLLSAVPVFADPSGSMHGSGHDYGKAGDMHHDDHHPSASHDSHRGYDSHSRSSHHDGMYKKHDGDHHPMHSSGYGKHHSKGHDGHGWRSHPGTHQGATEFIRHILRFKEGMSLTEDQTQQLHTLKTAYQKTRVKMKADVKLARIELHEILRNENSNLSDIEAQFNTMHTMKTKLYMASIKTKREAKAVLSPEQQSRMDKIHERIKTHGGNMAHPGAKPEYGKGKMEGR